MYIMREDKKITFETNDEMEIKLMELKPEDDKAYTESQYIKEVERVAKRNKERRNKIIDGIISALRENAPFKIDRENDGIINVKVIFDSDDKNSVFSQREVKKKEEDFSNWLKKHGIEDKNNN